MRKHELIAALGLTDQDATTAELVRRELDSSTALVPDRGDIDPASIVSARSDWAREYERALNGEAETVVDKPAVTVDPMEQNKIWLAEETARIEAEYAQRLQRINRDPLSHHPAGPGDLNSSFDHLSD